MQIQNKYILHPILFILLGCSVSTGFSQAVPQDTSRTLKSSYLSISTEVDSFYVVIDDNFENVYHLASRDTIIVSEGRHRLRIVKQYYRDLVTDINIKPDTLNEVIASLLPFRNLKNHKYLSSYPRIFWEAPVIVQTDPDARLYFDDEFVGKGLARIDTTGRITVTSELPDGHTETETFVTGNNKNEHTFISGKLYHRPGKQTSRFLSVLPGAGQIYKDQKIKGYALMGAILIGGALSYRYHDKFTVHYEAFQRTERLYENSTDPTRVFELGTLAEEQLERANELANRRDLLIGVTAGLYLYNIIDAWIKPRIGYRQDIEFDPYLDFTLPDGVSKGVTMTYNF